MFVLGLLRDLPSSLYVLVKDPENWKLIVNSQTGQGWEQVASQTIAAGKLYRT
jgi:hypothetical protein